MSPNSLLRSGFAPLKTSSSLRQVGSPESFRGLALPILTVASVLVLYAPGLLGEPQSVGLPFERQIINRFSLDHLPRSISIRYDQTTWLGYDLEHGKLYKAWRSTSDREGLQPADPKTGLFRVKSQGVTLFEDQTDATWRLRSSEKEMKLRIRYLGSTQREGGFELRWELSNDAVTVNLHERVAGFGLGSPREPAPVFRELRAQGLGSTQHLIPPPATSDRWTLSLNDQICDQMKTDQWYRLTLRSEPHD